MKKNALTAFLILLALSGCTKADPAPADRAIGVTAEKAVQKAMHVSIDAIGTVEANKSVCVYSQVTGQLSRIHFVEGQDVFRGKPLFTIDPAPFKEKLKQAEQRLAQSAAQLKFNEAEAKRYAFLVEKGAASRSDFEKNQTAAATQEAVVRADKAAVEDARLQLSYCYISAPLDGRTGAQAVKEGAVIKANDTQLVVINQITPVNVKFSIPEKQLAEIRKYRASGNLRVIAGPTADFRGEMREGRLTFIDNTVNLDTGMIQIKALFPNADKFLWPGQFVNVSVILKTEPAAVVVPARSLQTSEKERFVFVVKPDMSVEYRPVEVSRTMGQEAVIARGVAAGETLVTDGQLKLRPGAKVAILNTPKAMEGKSTAAFEKQEKAAEKKH